ncbi:MAG: hypothetical protein ACRDOI_02315 [Trebonia sp.]
MPDPLALARLRACRTVPVPLDASSLTLLEEAATAAGRHLLDVVLPDGGRCLMLGWPTEVDPVTALGLAAEEVPSPRPAVLLVLAAVIGCCWPSGDKPLLPGLPATQAEILAALARFTRKDSAQGSGPSWKRAITFLRACGFIAVDSDTVSVRLGPEVIRWDDADVRHLRDRHDDLPAPERSTR